MRTIRSADYEGNQVLIFGGESHEYDEVTFDPDAHYERLITDVRQSYDVDKILFRWLASDFMPYDRIPFIGPDPQNPSIYIATGYRAWGLAWAMSAAQGIVNYITGQPNDLIKPFSLDRLSTPLRDEDNNHGIA
jgi:glycine/D-amino acid oxidase-like deaminating enzyme